jgi:dynein heavy chain
MVALWQTECTAYMKRYERANKPVSSYLSDIQKYIDLKEEVGGGLRLGGMGRLAGAENDMLLDPQVLSEDWATNVRWLRLDSSTLKQQLVILCETWVSAFVELLCSSATVQLDSLVHELERGIGELRGVGMAQPRQPQDAAKAATSAADERQLAVEKLEIVHRRLVGNLDELQQRAAACQDKYEALLGLQVCVPDEELERVDRLPGLWAEFEAALEAVPARLHALYEGH